MKALWTVMLVALVDAPSARAGSILDTLISSSGARFTVKNCGTDTCGTIVWGKQKFVVKKSDVPSLFKDMEPRKKPISTEHEAAAVLVDRPQPVEAAPPSRAEDRTSPSRRSDEAAVALPDERSAPPAVGFPDTAMEAKDAAMPAAAKTAAPPLPAPPSPIGEWIAENGAGKVRISTCGQALCGVVAAANPDDTDWHNPDPGKRNRPLLGVPVLIDMKPAEKARWTGHVYSARSGNTYAATIALEGADVLRVEGCVFGGLFCSSQNWTRDKDVPAP